MQTGDTGRLGGLIKLWKRSGHYDNLNTIRARIILARPAARCGAIAASGVSVDGAPATGGEGGSYVFRMTYAAEAAACGSISEML